MNLWRRDGMAHVLKPFRITCSHRAHSTYVRAKEPLRFTRNWTGLVEILVLAFLLLAGSALMAQMPPLEAAQQLSTPAWQESAGTNLAFEVASIHLAKPGTFTPPRFALNIDDSSIPPGGRFFADFPLEAYIEFAYKIMPTPEQQDAMLAGLPNWVRADDFVIQAEAPGNPTKDQMRLMMQTLLADRFHLKAHFEFPIEPTLALVIIKHGILGPRIQPHSQGLPCDAKWTPPPDRTSPTVPPGGFIPECGLIQGVVVPGHPVMLGGRNTTLEQIAEYLAVVSGFGRPVVDEIGFSGGFDFTLQWAPEGNGPFASRAQSDTATGPDLIEALKEQFGMKLKSMRAPVRTLVIDHVEPPSPN
jgi:bla regulator protein blaR1